MVGQFIYLQDSLLEGIFLLSIAPEFIRGYTRLKRTHIVTVHKWQYSTLFLSTDIAEGHANPQKAFSHLGWKATATLDDVVKRMVDAVKDTR